MKIHLVLLAAAVCLVSCKAPPPPKNPSSGPDPADQEPEPEPIKVPESSATPEPSATGANPTAEPTGGKPACSGLQKSRCKVTVGCAWLDGAGKAKCVDE